MQGAANAPLNRAGPRLRTVDRLSAISVLGWAGLQRDGIINQTGSRARDIVAFYRLILSAPGEKAHGAAIA